MNPKRSPDEIKQSIRDEMELRAKDEEEMARFLDEASLAGQGLMDEAERAGLSLQAVLSEIGLIVVDIEALSFRSSYYNEPITWSHLEKIRRTLDRLRKDFA